MRLPLILTNCKNYPEALGENALRLAQIHAEVAKKTGKTFGIAVAALDLRAVAAKYGTEIFVFAQHLDPEKYGSSTGKIIPEELKKMGVFGTILNHSENRISNPEILARTALRAREAGIFTIVCAKDAEEGAKIMAACAPDLIAVEPPELIGGDISVSTAQPKLIAMSVEKIGVGKVLVGAGVKNREDVRIALELGAIGVLVASGVTKAADPRAALEDLAAGI